MHSAEPLPPLDKNYRWTKELTRYHWFVLVVAALGWIFDCLDQQLFNLARVPAMRELLATEKGVEASAALVSEYAGYSTSIFLIGWAVGGLYFGVLGDRIGRAKTMMLTILLYSAFTGLSALSWDFWSFGVFRFLTGLGVGGEFAVGVALVAEVMPHRARPFALGLLQALSALGNITAALLSIGLSHLEESGAVGSAWRTMFLIGTFPALLALLIRRRLKEPERWQQTVQTEDVVKKQLGSYRELFSDPRWRKNAIVGLILASSGVIGLWGIGFFSIDLVQSVFRKNFQAEAREKKETENDPVLLKMVMNDPALLDKKVAMFKHGEDKEVSLKPSDLLGPETDPRGPESIYSAIKELRDAKVSPITADAVLAHLDKPLVKDEKVVRKAQTANQRKDREKLLAGEPLAASENYNELGTKIITRAARIGASVTFWAGITSVLINIGAFCGMYAFSRVTHRLGRRKTFALAFIAAMFSTLLVFWKMETTTDLFWMVPLMGFCQLSIFGGYAIYFPELFPTRLRSTGTSFCYNVGRFVAALGPALLGILSSQVFGDSPEPMRPAGMVMCATFLIGLAVLPFAPETKDQPLPE